MHMGPIASSDARALAGHRRGERHRHVPHPEARRAGHGARWRRARSSACRRSPGSPRTGTSVPTASGRRASTCSCAWPPTSWVPRASASNSVRPGLVDDRDGRRHHGDRRRARRLPRPDAGRAGSGAPTTSPRSVRFLVGPESAWITGQTISVDGGHHLRRGPDYTPFAEPLYGADALRGLLPDETGS